MIPLEALSKARAGGIVAEAFSPPLLQRDSRQVADAAVDSDRILVQNEHVLQTALGVAKGGAWEARDGMDKA